MKHIYILKNEDWLIVNVNNKTVFNGIVHEFEEVNNIKIPYKTIEYNPLTNICVLDGDFSEIAPIDLINNIINILGVKPNDVDGCGNLITELPPPTLEEVKATKRAEINRIRDEKEMETLNNYDIDVKSAIRILFVQNKLMRTGGTIDWTMADNTEENVDATDMNAIVDAVVEQSNNVHNIANYLKAQIELATTVEEVNAIVWIDEIPAQ